MSNLQKLIHTAKIIKMEEELAFVNFQKIKANLNRFIINKIVIPRLKYKDISGEVRITLIRTKSYQLYMTFRIINDKLLFNY